MNSNKHYFDNYIAFIRSKVCEEHLFFVLMKDIEFFMNNSNQSEIVFVNINTIDIIILDEQTLLNSSKKYSDYFMANKRFITGYDVLLDRRANKVLCLKLIP